MPIDFFVLHTLASNSDYFGNAEQIASDLIWTLEEQGYDKEFAQIKQVKLNDFVDRKLTDKSRLKMCLIVASTAGNDETNTAKFYRLIKQE